MRIAILADIHGNTIALDNALADIQQRGGVDSYWILGDLCAIGYDPIGVLERLQDLPEVTVIRGNADRYVTSLDLPPPSIEQVQSNPELAAVLAEVSGTYHWTRGALDATGWKTWMDDLPYDHHLTLPDGTGVYLVHSAPDEDEGKGLNPSLTDDELDVVLNDIDAGLICVGHFHMPMHRYYRDKQIINPGSISNGFHQAGHACYALLATDTSGFNITFHAVPYDLNEAFRRARATYNLGNDYYEKILSGKITPSWKVDWDGVSHFPEIVTRGE